MRKITIVSLALSLSFLSTISHSDECHYIDFDNTRSLTIQIGVPYTICQDNTRIFETKILMGGDAITISDNSIKKDEETYDTKVTLLGQGTRDSSFMLLSNAHNEAQKHINVYVKK